MKDVKYNDVVVRKMEITPSLAKEWLDNSYKNNGIRQRRINQETVRHYAKTMSDGLWSDESLDMIGIDRYGRNINGQHRLKACVMADVSFVSEVKFGVSTETIHITDKGKPRNIADDMYINGCKNATALAATLKILYAYNSNAILRQKVFGLDYFSVKKMLDSYPYVVSVIEKYGSKMKTCRIVNPSWFLFIATVLHKNFASEFDDFFEQIYIGEGLRHDDITYILRKKKEEWMFKETKGMTMRPQHKAAFIITGWNKFIKGEKIKALRWSASQGFPEIVGAHKLEIKK